MQPRRILEVALHQIEPGDAWRALELFGVLGELAAERDFALGAFGSIAWTLG